MAVVMHSRNYSFRTINAMLFILRKIKYYYVAYNLINVFKFHCTWYSDVELSCAHVLRSFDGPERMMKSIAVDGNRSSSLRLQRRHLSRGEQTPMRVGANNRLYSRWLKRKRRWHYFTIDTRVAWQHASINLWGGGRNVSISQKCFHRLSFRAIRKWV